MKLNKILLVDDDSMIRDVFSLQLHDAFEAKIVTAANGKEALIRLDQGGWDLIITDNDMPVMNGLSFIEACRKRGINTPLIFMSGSMDPELSRTGKRMGATECVLKNAFVKVMKTTIEEVIERTSGG